MPNEIKSKDSELMDIESIYKDIKEKIITARSKMLKHIDTTMTEVYWYVGKSLMNYLIIVPKQVMENKWLIYYH